MFKRAKRANLRRRNDSEEDEPEDSAPPILAPTLFGPIAAQVPFLETSGPAESLPSNGVLGSPLKAAKKEKKGREVAAAPAPTKASLLSFDDEEDESEVFRVKKSTHSKKIVKQLKREYKEDLEKTGVVKQEPRSDGVPGCAIKEEATGAVSDQEPLEAMEVDGSEDPDDAKPPGGHAAPPAPKSKSTAATFSSYSSLNSLRPGEIPDAAFIHAARKRRQLARELGGDAPLVETEEPKKRMGQEDQDCSEDEDDEKRIRFSGVKSKSQRQKIAEEIGIEGSDDEALDQGQDEEVSRWEQEQIRKGISIPQVQSQDESSGFYPNAYETHPYGSSYSVPFTYGPVAAPGAKVAALAGNGSVQFGPSVGELTPVSIDLVKKRLEDRLSHMSAGHQLNITHFHQIQEDLAASESAIQQLEGSANDNAEQYKFLQEMRGYVGDLLECFGEKVPAVLELEAAMHQLLRQRASRLVQRRQDDIKDESSEFASLSSVAVVAPSLDSFGRDRGAYQESCRQRRIAEREARRTRRRQAREQGEQRAEHREGLSSDDEETTTDVTSFHAERERILKEGRKVFEDVLEDFHSLDCIKARLERWRRGFSQCYRDAYIGLCLPKLFSPLVRLQLLAWNPLETPCENFECMLWFESLLFYGFEEDSELQRGDADAGLLPAIVEKVVLPKLTVLAEQAWDPLSSSQTSRLVAFLQRLAQGYPTVVHGDSQYTQELLKVIVLRVRRALDQDVFLPLFPKHALENKNSAPYLFYQRQFWTCVKLLGNVLLWDGILSPSCLKDLALDSTLNRHILSALQTCDAPEENALKCKKVVETLPGHWLAAHKGPKTLPQLEPFCRYLAHLANTFHRGATGASDVERRAARDHVKELVQMLARLKALDHIMAVAQEQGIRDVKALLDLKS